MEAASSGLLAGINLARILKKSPLEFTVGYDAWSVEPLYFRRNGCELSADGGKYGNFAAFRGTDT